MNVGNFSNIPHELRALKQWVVWREGKVPFQVNGTLADVTNPNTWNSFENCAQALLNPLNLGIGFVFTANDPYSFIDLDNAHGDQAILATHLKIAHEFNSYSEVSPSGMGLHIIVKGTVIAGRRRSKVEIYSSARYATMTGQVHNNSPIVDCQAQLTQLWEQMGSGPVAQSLYQGNDKETDTDEAIIKKATDAVNGDKFAKLLKGNWQDLYSSQSEADFAFIDILAFYTQNRNQLIRIFRSSPLGFRDKAKRHDYLSGMISRSFDRMLPPLDFDGMKNALELKLAKDQLALPLGSVAQRLEPSAHNGLVVGSSPATSTNKTVSDNGSPSAFDAASLGSNPSAVAKPYSDFTASGEAYNKSEAIRLSASLPPGLLGEIASFIYQAAPRPVPEVALAAAIGLMAGICGRAYNISGTGLNQYVLLLAMTGAGKEAAASGINKLMNTIKMQVPTSTGFIGPSEISSGSALFKYLGNSSQSFISLLGEFGLRLQQMSSPNANGSEVSLRRMFLDLYNKSGYSEILHASVYSDKANNTSAVPSPSFSILGESTPERFYGALNEDMISEGLLPRFLLIEYKGNRPPLNEHHTSVIPSFSLVERLASLAAQCETVNHSNPRRVINVNSSPEASRMLFDFDKYADNRINSSNKEVIRQLWNRAHIKVLKLSALIAVGENMIEPVISAHAMTWAADLIQADIAALTERFEAGEIGANSFEVKQAQEIVRMIKEYIRSPYDKIEKYMQLKSPKMHHDKVIPYVYLNKRLAPMSAFRNDRIGGTGALKRTIQNLIDGDRIREVGKVWTTEKYGTNQRCFMVNDTSILD